LPQVGQHGVDRGLRGGWLARRATGEGHQLRQHLANLLAHALQRKHMVLGALKQAGLLRDRGARASNRSLLLPPLRHQAAVFANGGLAGIVPLHRC
jgi:hypothetical protein